MATNREERRQGAGLDTGQDAAAPCTTEEGEIPLYEV